MRLPIVAWVLLFGVVSIARASSVGFPKDAHPVKAVRPILGYVGPYKLYRFDINNDGKQEAVLGYHSRSGYRDGDIYFVYADGKIPHLSVATGASTNSVQAYGKTATRIIPQYWADFQGTAEKQLEVVSKLLRLAILR